MASVEAVEPFELIMGRLSAADRSDPDQARPANIHIHIHTHIHMHAHIHTQTHTHRQTNIHRHKNTHRFKLLYGAICISIDSQSKKSQGSVAEGFKDPKKT